MTTTHRERASFNAQVIVDVLPEFLDEAIYWIAGNLKPDDVFSDEQLAAWAKENDFVPAAEIQGDF